MWKEILAKECAGLPVTKLDLPFDEKAVRYHWLKSSQEAWRLADDPVESARAFITENGKENMIGLLDVEAAPGTTVLAFQVTDFMEAWAENTRELAMDSTCKWCFFYSFYRSLIVYH